ncbi:hypothetical protein BCR25_16605 [Enterococcus termitis]|uniref:Uncharacterized protein n=1 Tax=Enterococcus termitis TaxID=332950 RepID=A0A1E5H0U8_9ENTE|nr:hypothetical protein BCR25_16605 [Enterococcus termitis]
MDKQLSWESFQKDNLHVCENSNNFVQKLYTNLDIPLLPIEKVQSNSSSLDFSNTLPLGSKWPK